MTIDCDVALLTTAFSRDVSYPVRAPNQSIEFENWQYSLKINTRIKIL